MGLTGDRQVLSVARRWLGCIDDCTFSGRDDEMRTTPDHLGLRLEKPCETHQIVARSLVVPPLDEIRENPSRSFDSIQSFDVEARSTDFIPQFLWPVKVCRREVIESIRRIFMLTIEEIALYDAVERRIAKQAANQRIKRRCPPGYPGRDQNAVGAQDSGGFAKGLVAIPRVDQVVERSEQKHDVNGIGCVRNGARVTNDARCQRVNSLFVSDTRDFDEARHGINEANVIALFGKPKGICTGSAADIENACRWRWDVTQDQFARSGFFETERSELQARLFRRAIIVIFNRRIELRGSSFWHRAM